MPKMPKPGSYAGSGKGKQGKLPMHTTPSMNVKMGPKDDAPHGKVKFGSGTFVGGVDNVPTPKKSK